MSALPAAIAAMYFDGRSARKHAVQLALSDGQIVLTGMDAPKVYALGQARLAEPFGGAPCVLDLDDGARIEVERSAYPLLRERLRYRRSPVEVWQQHWQGALLALVIMVGAVLAMARWGVPAAAEAIVAALPASVDRQAGDQAFDALQGRLLYPSRLDPARIAEVGALFDTVRPRSHRLPLRLKVMRMQGDVANAIALPNGTIIMSDAMVRHAFEHGNTPPSACRAQLAGVLAHEIGHIQGRHGMRSVVRGSLLAAGSAALFGDFSAVAAGIPALLMNLDYSREMERAADDYAIVRLGELGISTAPLADLFESLEHSAGEAGEQDWLDSGYISSHPATAERSRRFRGAAAAR